MTSQSTTRRRENRSLFSIPNILARITLLEFFKQFHYARNGLFTKALPLNYDGKHGRKR
jgi:hypothetical protein